MYVLSDGLFYPLYYTGRYRRKITRKNLVASFPEKSEKEIVKIEKRFYHFFIDIFFETCKFVTISKEEIGKRMKFTNIDDINAILQQEKSISLYLGHYGIWEWVSSMALWLDKHAVSGQIYHRLHDRTVDKLLLQSRGRFGATNIEMKETPRWINAHVRNQQVTITGYIADQSPRRSNQQHYVRFLNHQAPALTGTEKITKKYRFEAYFLDVKRIKRGYYEAEFVKMHEDPQNLPDFELTDIYYRLLEKMIRRQPELYLWTHNRFKHASIIKQDFYHQ
ncbi:lipid A biosynthesis protein [Bacteroidia bacterium]|nr:lipid A biosynthesis protein [Bacteroidia bacterium]GHT50944.1 lipid A biosynthesis protein [Bacteroidia bacterium]